MSNSTLDASGCPRPRHRDAALFRVNRAAQCRQWIWNRLRIAYPGAVTLTDLARDAEGFSKTAVYTAARSLTLHGFVSRVDMEWGELRGGKERRKRRVAVKFAPKKFTVGASGELKAACSLAMCRLLAGYWPT